MQQPSYVYILASKRNGTLYAGVATELEQRISQHREKVFAGFTKKYRVTMLVYYEVYDDIESAIRREKNIKAWKRKWKLEAIEKMNPEWKDLFPEICR